MSPRDLGGLFDVLLTGELIVVGPEHLDGADVPVEANLFQGIRKALVVQAVAALARPEAFFVIVVGCAAGHVFCAVQVPDEDFLSVGLLQRVPARGHGVEMELIQRHTHQGGVDLLHDGIGILEAVDGHGGCAAELQGQLDAVRLHLLDHLFQHRHGVGLDFIHRGVDRQVHGGYDHNHLAVQNLATADDLMQLIHHSVLLRLGLLHVEKDQGVVGQHFQLMVLKEALIKASKSRANRQR